MRNFARSQSGFTLIELLTIIGTIGILGGMSIAAFQEYKGKATYQVAFSTVSSARSALEAALTEPDATYSNVAMYTQAAPGPVGNASASQLLPGLMLPKNNKIYFSFDPTCLTSACISAVFTARHCSGIQYASWTRFGDGTEILMENVAGSGCP
ncbi:MAG: hypothetical protein K1X79_13015 [Oligoflexia bacterium]|nr:hypothetical protein [Oligoflexia bacterium]